MFSALYNSTSIPPFPQASCSSSTNKPPTIVGHTRYIRQYRLMDKDWPDTYYQRLLYGKEIVVVYSCHFCCVHSTLIVPGR